jgi:hypothetical protein
MLKNRTVQIALGVVLLVLVGLGGFYVIANKTQTKTQDQTSTEGVVQTLKPEEIGLSLEVSPDKKKVKFKIEKASDIKGIEYELVYEADSTAQEKQEGGDETVQRGITGQADIKSGESSYESDWLDLGSCSKNVCRYDTGVKKIDITLKLTKSGDKIYSVTDTKDLE